MKLIEVAEKYMIYAQTRRSYSPATIRNYKSDVERFCHWVGHIEAATLTEETLEEYFLLLRHPEGREARAATVRRYWQTVRTLCRWGHKKGYFPADIVPDVEMPKPDGSRRVLITDDEVQSVLEATTRIVSPQRRALSRVILYILSTAAIRCAELSHMRIEDMSLESQQITVVKGKGGKLHVVPINDICAVAIREWLALRPKNCQHTFLLTHDPVRHVSDFGIRQIVREAAHLAGFAGAQKDKFHPHTLRHNCALRFYRNSKFDIEATRKFLGHSKITTTQIYLDVEGLHLHEMRNLTSLDAAAAVPDVTTSERSTASDAQDLERLMPMAISMAMAMLKEMRK